MMELFDIGPYVNQGDNRLYISVDSEAGLLKLAVSGLVLTTEGSLKFNSDGRWRTLTTVTNDHAGSAAGAVIVMQRIQNRNGGANLTLNFKEIMMPLEMSLDRAIRFSILVAMLFVAVASGLMLLHLIIRRFDPMPFWQDLETLALPVLGGTVLAIGLIILSYDIRVDAQSLLHTQALTLIGLIVLHWEAIVMIERIIRGSAVDE
jgi:hypothetical protein